ncbi:hypothetical protein B7463_g976, partial [Scytalidium lignicola]
MASQKDLQDLLRILTTGRNKMPMLGAMGRVKALQAAGLRSVAAIASTDLETLQKAIGDDKAAKSLQTACKASVKDPDKKRNATTALSSPAKRTKSAYELPTEPQSPEAFEASLALPQPSEDEEAISKTVIYTNRAPLVLAFAVELLKFTMPEQPLSSRLSLAQAVVSANSRSKAVSLGLEKGASAEAEGWGAGQPKVRILGREVHILKRSGYNWTKEEQEPIKEENSGEQLKEEDQTTSEQDTTRTVDVEKSGTTGWTTSASVTLKHSTFVARSITVTSPLEARLSIQKLLAENKDLREASHNITAWRVQGNQGGVMEGCDDDGEKGGGSHLLELLRSNGTSGILIVVTRWYGGVMLGPDRWRLMTQVARDALSQRLRVTGIIGQESLWGLDLESMRSTSAPVTGGTAAGMPIHKPEGARAYIMKAFASPPLSDEGASKKKKSGVALEKEKEANLGLLLGALDMLFGSWVEHISRDELDRRAWGWYVQVRPEVESGVAGWGGKGEIRLKNILDLRRKG